MTFLCTLQIIPLSNNTTFSLCPHFQCTCPALLAHSGSTVYSDFTVLPFVLWLDIFAVYLGHFWFWEKFCTLQTFKKYKFLLCPNFHCKFGIQWMLQIAVDLQCFTVLSLHLHCILTWYICSVLEKVLLLFLGGFCFNNPLFQLCSALLTIFVQFPIKFIDVFCYLQILEVWLQRLEEMKSSLRGHIGMHNVKVCFPNCPWPPYQMSFG